MLIRSCTRTTTKAKLAYLCSGPACSAVHQKLWAGSATVPSTSSILLQSRIQRQKRPPSAVLESKCRSLLKSTYWPEPTSFDVVEESPDGEQTHPWLMISELQCSVLQRRMWGLKHCGQQQMARPALLVGSYWPTTRACMRACLWVTAVANQSQLSELLSLTMLFKNFQFTYYGPIHIFPHLNSQVLFSQVRNSNTNIWHAYKFQSNDMITAYCCHLDLSCFIKIFTLRTKKVQWWFWLNLICWFDWGSSWVWLRE